jgi:hypothetical protein
MIDLLQNFTPATASFVGFLAVCVCGFVASLWTAKGELPSMAVARSTPPAGRQVGA